MKQTARTTGHESRVAVAGRQSHSLLTTHYSLRAPLTTHHSPRALLTTHYSLHSSKAQSTLEYAVVLAAVCAALLAMKVYLRRGIAGELRRAADSLGEQYDPRNTTGNLTLGSLGNTTAKTETLNEPDLTAWSKAECLARGRPAAECNAICVDLSDPPNGCTDLRVFGTISKLSLNNETATRTGTETVGALGTDLWN